MPHHVMPVKGFLSPEPPAHQLYMPTPSAPAPESIRSLAPRRSLLRNLYLPLLRSEGVYGTAAFGLLLPVQVFWSQKESQARYIRSLHRLAFTYI